MESAKSGVNKNMCFITFSRPGDRYGNNLNLKSVQQFNMFTKIHLKISLKYAN